MRVKDRYTAFEWLVRLRWLVLSSQAVTLVAAAYLLSLPLKLFPILALVTIAGVSNVFLARVSEPLSTQRWFLASVVIADVLLLTLLLYLSGGPENPFSIIYLLYVILGGMLLSQRWSLVIAVLTSALFLTLFYTHVPLHGSHHHGDSGQLNLHLVSMWVAYSLVALIAVVCVSSIAQELRDRERESERLILEQERLAALTTLAAGAAHELATPLGTITISLGELERELKLNPSSSEIFTDLELMNRELTRCKEILSKMGAQAGEAAGEPCRSIALQDFIAQLEAQMSNSFKDQVTFSVRAAKEVVTVAPSALIQSISSLVKNAVDASGSSRKVELQIVADSGAVKFLIVDSGCGMSEDVLARVGEPFFTTKEVGRGMGLGVFLARLTAERLGGRMQLRSKRGEGTTVELTLPLETARL